MNILSYIWGEVDKIVQPIQLDSKGKVIREVPALPRGRYVVQETILISLVTFAIIGGAAWGSIWIATNVFGWQKKPIGSGLFGIVMIVAGLFVGWLIGTATGRHDKDHEAVGNISAALKMMIYSAGGNAEMIRLIAVLASHIFAFFCAHPVYITSGQKQLRGAWPVLAKIHGDVCFKEKTPWLETENRLQYQIYHYDIVKALGGIASRRMYKIIWSRFVVNIMYTSVGVYLMILAALTDNDVPWVLGVAVAFMFHYGLSTVFRYIKRMQNGIGTDPGDNHPDVWLEGIFVEIDAACDEAKIKPEERPWKTD